MAGPSNRVTCNKAIGNKCKATTMPPHPQRKSPSLVVKHPVRANSQLKTLPEEIIRGGVPQERLQKTW